MASANVQPMKRSTEARLNAAFSSAVVGGVCVTMALIVYKLN